MKKTVVLALMLAFVMPLAAQRHEGKHQEKKHKEITELVSDLSSSQKRKMDAISRESKEKVSALRAQQKAVRDSIAMFMNLEGDQSGELYPLFDREAELQTAISREMYSTKLRVDALLTKEQRGQLRAAFEKERKHK